MLVPVSLGLLSSLRPAIGQSRSDRLPAGPAGKALAPRGALPPISAGVDGDPWHPQQLPQCQGSGAAQCTL